MGQDNDTTKRKVLFQRQCCRRLARDSKKINLGGSNDVVATLQLFQWHSVKSLSSQHVEHS
jgi:hypothetical protein